MICRPRVGSGGVAQCSDSCGGVEIITGTAIALDDQAPAITSLRAYHRAGLNGGRSNGGRTFAAAVCAAYERGRPGVGDDEDRRRPCRAGHLGDPRPPGGRWASTKALGSYSQGWGARSSGRKIGAALRVRNLEIVEIYLGAPRGRSRAALALAKWMQARADPDTDDAEGPRLALPPRSSRPRERRATANPPGPKGSRITAVPLTYDVTMGGSGRRTGPQGR
jgi:hypothetical protein